MFKTKYESERELTDKELWIINRHKENLPRYSIDSGIGYYVTLFDNENRAKITYYYGHGYFYKIKYEVLEQVDDKPKYYKPINIKVDPND